MKKECKECGQVLPANKDYFTFWRNSKKEITLRPICKECKNKKERLAGKAGKYKEREEKRRSSKDYKQKALQSRRKRVEAKKQYDKAYREKNKQKRLANNKARAQKQQAFYNNLSEDEKQKVVRFYELRDELNLCALGVGAVELFEVDHILPLNGESLCGLHVAHNLQILSKSENNAKSNSVTL